jgi:hypothetical protein
MMDVSRKAAVLDGILGSRMLNRVEKDTIDLLSVEEMMGEERMFSS